MGLAVPFSQFIKVAVKKPPRDDNMKVSKCSGFIMDFLCNFLQAFLIAMLIKFKYVGVSSLFLRD